jgi:formate hydrogenlyase subunit 4
MNDAAAATMLGIIQVTAVVAAAPLLNGFIKKIKARFQLRQGPPLLQGYRDLAKWFSRSEQVADSASFAHVLAPAGVLAATVAALLFVPVFGERTPLTASGDLIVVVGLLALARALLTLGGMDSGGAFGQMGSSRELAIGALVEPVLMLSLAALALQPQSTRLGEIVAFGDGYPGSFLGLGWALALAAFTIVLVAETGRIPVDNPDTHLELTMVHEGMLIEYSGRSLGLLHCAAMTKQLLLAVLLANLFVPFGMGRFGGVGGYALGAALVTVKVAVVGVGLAVVESAFAKKRLFELPDLIGAAGFSATLGVALTVLFA